MIFFPCFAVSDAYPELRLGFKVIADAGANGGADAAAGLPATVISVLSTTL
jgi:hypothetical protein